MDERARLLVIERCAPARAAPDPSLQAVLRSDLRMMVATGGLERTEREFDALVAAAGRARRRTVRAQSPFSVMDVAAG